MSAAAFAAAVLVVAWAVLVIVAQLLNPEQSPLAMGMSGLARGRAPWVMKSAFLCRGASALWSSCSRFPAVLGTAALTLAGIAAFWLWGVGSAAPRAVRHGHAGRAAVARRRPCTPCWRWWPTSPASPARSCCRWCCFAVTTPRAWPSGRCRSRSRRRRRWRCSSSPSAPRRERRARRASPPFWPRLDPGSRRLLPPPRRPPPRPPRRGPCRPAAARRRAAAAGAGAADPPVGPSPAGRGDGPSASLTDLAGYAGLLQRIFIGLLMAWTLLVALGVGRL